jgi:branched-chain amino acid transport system substrate-binding protein
MVRKCFQALVAALTGVVAGVPAGCSDDPSPAAPAPSPPVVFGAMAPLTGAQETLGPGVQRMLQLAESQVNARGGVLDRHLDLDIRDDGSDPMTAMAAANALLDPSVGAVGLIAPSTSSEALALVDIMRAAGKPMISGLALSPELSTREPPRDRFFFRTQAPAQFQARNMARFLRSPSVDSGTPPAACSRLAVFHYDDLSGVGNPVATELTTRFQADGGTVVADVKVDPQAKTYEPEIQQLLATDAQCQVLLMLGSQGALYLRQFRTLTKNDTSRDWSAFVTMGSTSFFSAGFIASGRTDPTDPSLPSAAEGIYGTANDLAPETQEYSSLLNLYRTQFTTDADGGTLAPPPTSVYDAVLLLALAVQKAGSTDGGKIRDALFDVSSGGRQFGPLDYAEAVAALRRGEDIDYQGASGACDLDDNGDVVQDEIVWSVHEGALRTEGHVSAESLK